MPKLVVASTDDVRALLGAAEGGDRVMVRFASVADRRSLAAFSGDMGLTAKFHGEDPLKKLSGLKPEIWANRPQERETVIGFKPGYSGALAAHAYLVEAIAAL